MASNILTNVLNDITQLIESDGEDQPLGLILCAEKQQEHIELLELNKRGIHVAQYLTKLLPHEILEEKLRKAIIIGREKFNKLQMIEKQNEETTLELKNENVL